MTKSKQADTLLLRVQGASKAYPDLSLKNIFHLGRELGNKALDNVSLAMQAGQVAALLGPNGAGKTTLINIICGLTAADSGTVSVAGIPVMERALAAQKKIGYVNANDRSFFWRLTGRHNLEFFGTLQGLSHRSARQRTAQMLQRFGMSAHADRRFYTYSAGMKKRLGLGRALMHDPQLILMDEATNGLDAEGAEYLINFVRQEMVPAGKSILWATHRPEEVEKICDQVIILGSGKVRFNDDIETFRNFCNKKTGFVLEVKIPTENLQVIAAIIHTQDANLSETVTRGIWKITGIRDQLRLSSLIRDLAEHDASVRKIEHMSDPLHEVFKKLGARP